MDVDKIEQKAYNAGYKDGERDSGDYKNAHGILNQNGLELQDQLAKRYSDLRVLAQYAAHKKDCGIFDERVDCTCDYPYELVADILETAGCFFEDWDDTTIPPTCHCLSIVREEDAHEPTECDTTNQKRCPQFRDALNWSVSDYLPKEIISP